MSKTQWQYGFYVVLWLALFFHAVTHGQLILFFLVSACCSGLARLVLKDDVQRAQDEKAKAAQLYADTQRFIVNTATARNRRNAGTYS